MHVMISDRVVDEGKEMILRGLAITCQKHPKALARSHNENICKTEAA